MKRTNMWLGVFCNAVFLLYGFHYLLSLNNFILSILINLLIFIVPGVGWIGILKKKVKDNALLLFFIVCFSLGIWAVGLVGHHILRIEPTSFTFFLYLCVITNVGIFFSRNSKTLEFFIGKKKEFLVFILSSFLVYGGVYYGAKTFPALIDFDINKQGTSYGLLYELKPYLTSDICPVYFYFDHPPLTNLYSAFGILLFDKIEEFKYYYDFAKAAEKILASKPGDNFFISFPNEEDTPLNIRVLNRDNTEFILTEKHTTGKEITRSLSRKEICPYLSVYNRKLFFQKGLLLEGRTANIFVSILMFWSLFKLAFYLTQSQLLGIFVGLLYVFSPGIFVRSCNLAHLAITNYGLFILAYHYIGFDNDKMFTWRHNLLMFLPGIFAALTDQKTLILIAAIVLLNAIRWTQREREKYDGKYCIINSSVIGYMLGMAIFWTYGFLIDKQSFILSHIRTHFLDRIFHHQQMFFYYPSIWVLWKEFQIEFPAFILAIFALVFLWKKYIQKKEGIFILWFLVGAFSFSIVDWKQTKHLMCLAPALVVVLMMTFALQKKWFKVGFMFLLMGVLLYCLWFNTQLLNDFAFYRPTADW